MTVADLGGEGLGDPPTPLFWAKKEEITEGRKAGRASKTKPGPLVAQGLDPPLDEMIRKRAENGNLTGCVSIDLSKAFDTISHF